PPPPPPPPRRRPTPASRPRRARRSRTASRTATERLAGSGIRSGRRRAGRAGQPSDPGGIGCPGSDTQLRAPAAGRP
ncbi:hypothetical protein C9F04_01820, partial [Salmonella enterica subsp. enterica serovar Wilhelmsburg]